MAVRQKQGRSPNVSLQVASSRFSKWYIKAVLVEAGAGTGVPKVYSPAEGGPEGR